MKAAVLGLILIPHCALGPGQWTEGSSPRSRGSICKLPVQGAAQWCALFSLCYRISGFFLRGKNEGVEFAHSSASTLAPFILGTFSVRACSRTEQISPY